MHTNQGSYVYKLQGNPKVSFHFSLNMLYMAAFILIVYRISLVVSIYKLL